MAAIGLHGDGNRSASHRGEGAIVIDLNRLQMGWEVEDVLGRRDRPPSEPRDTNASWIRVLRHSLVPSSAVQMLDEVIERCGVANLLNARRIWGLVVDGGRQPLNLLLVGGPRLRSRRMAWLEQILDVPRHDLEHRRLLSIRLMSAARRLDRWLADRAARQKSCHIASRTRSGFLEDPTNERWQSARRLDPGRSRGARASSRRDQVSFRNARSSLTTSAVASIRRL